MAEPPSGRGEPVLAGAVHETVDDVTPFGVPETLVGAFGTVEGITDVAASDAKPEPSALTALSLTP
jgi:hypothetical protein